MFAFIFLFVNILSFSGAYLTHQQDTNFSLIITSNNATNCNITAIQYPSGIANLFDLIMEKNTQTFNYTIDSSNFTSSGDTCIDILCYDGTQYEPGSVCRTVTPSGQELDIGQALIFIIMFFLLFVFLAFSVYGLVSAYNITWQIFYICSTYILLFSLFFICWLFTNNYLWDTPILASIFWIIWLVLAIMFFPFIIFVSSYLIIKQLEELTMNDYISQGYSKDEAHSMSKRRKK